MEFYVKSFRCNQAKHSPSQKKVLSLSLLGEVCAAHRLAHAWFLEITLMHEYMCVCVYALDAINN